MLMADAQGRGIKRDVIAQYATLSMAGYLRESIYRTRRNLFDEIYDREDAANGPTATTKLWRGLEQAHANRASASSQDSDLELDVCMGPVDGVHALSDGKTGGTVSVLGFAAHQADKPIFAPPREGDDVARGRGAPSDADRSPPWLVLCGSEECALRLGRLEQICEFVQKIAGQSEGELVEDFVNRLFTDPGPCGRTESKLPIKIERRLAVLDEPRYYLTWDRRASPPCKKRVFTGSSIATCLTAMFESRGFDCGLAIMRHAHVVRASIAARALGGFVVAVPLRRHPSRIKSKSKSIPLTVESDEIWTHTSFVRSNDAALIVSGISENVVLGPVRIRENHAWVHTLSLSARTKSVRKLEHRITLSGPSATRFACFDDDVLEVLDAGDELPGARWDSAGAWRDQYDEVLDRHLP